MFTSSQQLFPIELDESIAKSIPRPESPQRSRFSKEEDQLLKLLVSSQSQPKWSEIATNFQNRTARQCRERYNNYLRPDLINGPWTKEEDDLLIELYKTHGPKWSLISQSFSSRSSVNVKNHHSSLQNQLTKSKSSNIFKIEIIKRESQPKVEISPIQLNETVQLHETAQFNDTVQLNKPFQFNETFQMNETVQLNEKPQLNENVQIEETIKVDKKEAEPVQNYNEDYYSYAEDENNLLDFDYLQNMLSNFKYEEEMWSGAIQVTEEDNLFAF